MRLNDNVMLRTIANQHMIVDGANGNLDMTDIYTLNGSAAYLWKCAEGRDFDVAFMVEKLCEKYEVDEQTAKDDVEAMLEEWREYGLVK